jgi:transcriptional regulator with XRE-family HTH domain
MLAVSVRRQRARELGALLRALRTRKGWTAEQVAARLLVSPSKVSRLETGQRGARARDIRDLCDLYEVDGEQRQHLLELASEGKQRAWWQPLGLPYSTYLGLEAEATTSARPASRNPQHDNEPRGSLWQDRFATVDRYIGAFPEG